MNELNDVSTTSLPRLPLDMIDIIAQYLIVKDHHRTCANLNLACRAVKEVTDPILWQRVVYKWNNISKRKKSENKWRAVFESDGARFIQFLTVIPLHKPDVKLDYKTANLPFLTTLTSKENRLNMCIVPSKDQRELGVYLFEHYEPCTSKLYTLMELVEEARLLTKGCYIDAYLHPCTSVAISSRTSLDCDDLTTMLVHASSQLPALGEWEFAPLLGVNLVMPVDAHLPLTYVKGIVTDMFALIRPSCGFYCANDATAKIGIPTMMVRFDMWCGRVDEAMMVGECIKVAYRLDQSFAACGYRVRTKDPLTGDQARFFTNIMERAYLATYPKFRNQPPGGPSITDESCGTTIVDPPPSMANFNPFGPVDEVQGMLQYLPAGETAQAVRAIMVPDDQGDSVVELLDVLRVGRGA